MSYYALTDSDWSWDDESEGRAIVVYADTPEEAVKAATEKHIKEFPGAGGICWKVARLWNLGLEMVDWEDGNKPNYAGFDYYPDGCNGPIDTPVRQIRNAAAPAPTLSLRLESIAHRVHALARMVGTSFFEDVEKDLRDLSSALSAQVQDVATAAEFADRMFTLHGFILCERHNGKHAVTVTFPNLAEAQQFHGALVDLSRHTTAAAPAKQEGGHD